MKQSNEPEAKLSKDVIFEYVVNYIQEFCAYKRIPIEDMRLKKQEPEMQVVRVEIAKKLKEKLFPITDIADALNCDESTVRWYLGIRKKHKKEKVI